MCVSSGKRKGKRRGAFLEFLIGYNTNMARRRRKKKKEILTTSRPIEVVPDDYSSWTGDGLLKDTPFASLKSRLKQAARATGCLAGKSAASAAVRGKFARPAENIENRKEQVTGYKETGVVKPDTISSRNGRILSDGSGDIQPEDESMLFLQAMDGVRPLSRKVHDPSKDMRPASVTARPVSESEAAVCAEELGAIVRGDKDIPVEHTPEYVEGPVINSNPQIVRKLRRGKFSVQGYCDLHGLTTMEALDWCEEFMARSIAANRSCVAIIHGRGLSSPRGPVLKKMVQEWLTKGKWRRHVIAYSSAPNWDGGSGVTYVLLRQRPAPRKKRRKLRLWSE